MKRILRERGEVGRVPRNPAILMARSCLARTFAVAATCWPALAAALLGASCSSEQGVGGSSASGGIASLGSGGAHVGSGGSNAGASGAAGGGVVGSSGAGGLGTGVSGSGGLGTDGSGSGGIAGAAGNGTGTGGSAGAASAAGGASAGVGGTAIGAAGGQAGGGGSGGASVGPFVCNQLTGGKLTEEWFIAGFETTVDNSRWQVKWREDAYVEVWADANSSFWTAQIDSACAKGSSTPDRLVFGAVSFKYKTQAEWRTGITQAVNNFKAKWPSLRRVDLVTQIRGPQNMLCPTAPIAGETIAVPPEQDAAMAEVAAALPGFVFVGPKVLAHSCSEFQGGGPHLTAAGNQANVPGFSSYFVEAQ